MDLASIVANIFDISIPLQNLGVLHPYFALDGNLNNLLLRNA